MNATTKRRWLLWALPLIGLAALAGWAFRPQPLVVETAPARLGRFVQAVDEDGRLRVRQRYLIAAPTAAELMRPVLKVGDRVDAGQVVAVLLPVAPQMIDARSRAVLQERLGSAEAARSAAQAQVRRLQAALAQARLEAERADTLARQDFVAASARDQAALALRVQTQALQAGEAELHMAEHALGETRAALQRAQGLPGTATAGRWELRSPVAGRVIKLHQDSAAPVTVGQPLIEVADTTQLEAVVDLLSGDALRVKPGAAVQLGFGTGLPKGSGRVQRIEPAAFTKVSALGIEEQRVNLVIDVDAPPPGLTLGDGFSVDARITVVEHDGALLVPAAALVRDGSGWAVYVVADGVARRQRVELRDRHAELAWLAGGVEPGQAVVLYPGLGISDGRRVRVRAAPDGAR